METINNQTSSTEATKAKVRAFFSRPGVSTTVQVLTGAALVTIGAFLGYRSGKKAGDREGQVKGYAHALDEIGVTPAEVPTMAAAWAESKREMAEAVNQAASTSAAMA